LIRARAWPSGYSSSKAVAVSLADLFASVILYSRSFDAASRRTLAKAQIPLSGLYGLWMWKVLALIAIDTIAVQAAGYITFQVKMVEMRHRFDQCQTIFIFVNMPLEKGLIALSGCFRLI